MTPLLQSAYAMTEPPADSGHRTEGERPQPQRIVRSEDLLQGQKEVQIEHGGEIYRLRLTRNGRLVLYK